MRRSFEGKRHQPAKSEEKRKRCDRKHRGFGFFCAFLLCAGLISGGAAVSGESGAQEAVNAEAPADDAVQPEVPAQPVEEAQQNTPAPEDTEGGGEAGQQQEETPDQQQEELYPEDDGNGEESVPSVSRPDAGSAESSAAPVGTTAEPLTVSVTTAMKYAFAGENALTFETQITGGTEPFETSCEIDRDGTPVWSSQEYQPEVTYMPEEAGGYELVLSVTDAAGQAASGRCAIPVAVRHEESPSDWEPALKEVRMTGRYAEDLLAIARTQLGYTESADNFIVTEEGARQGYTRYGQWQGDAYEPWDAAFAAFCLYYAGVRDVPADTKAEKWADELKRRGMYRDLTAENRPEEGDFLFTRDGEVTRIGLVEKTDDTGVTAIEGDVGGAVARVTYGWDDARLAGFGDPRTTLTDEAAGVAVTGIFPEGATLTVQLLAEDADGFTEAQDRIHAALSPLYDRYAVNLADVTETAVYVPSLTVNGEVVSPCKKVRVGVSACGGRFAGHGDVRVLTFSDEQTELLSAEEKDGGDGADAIVSASFRTDRLSEFALTAVAPDRLTMRRTAADGDAKVTVTYGAGAGVPESAELRVRQIRGDGDDADRAEYQKRQAEAAALLETEAGGENAASQPDTAASGSPGNAENADVSRQTDQNAENAAADQQADQNAENAAADQTEDSKEYAAYMEEVEAALASGRKVQMAKLFDITILDKEGNEVEPLTPVRANIEFVPKEVQEGTDLELYQFQTEGEKPQVMENVEVLTDDDNIVNGIEFETDGFSVYGIVGTEVLTGGVMTADGDSYSVTVKYDKYAEIPDDAVLVATEVQNSSRLYQSYMSEAEDALTSDSDAEISFARFFDVSIMADGEKIQPATPAEVIIDYNESQEITEGTEVSTLQFGDSVPATVDAAVSGTDTQVDGVSFQAEEVSVYGIVGTETLTGGVVTADGSTYEVTVTYGPDAGIPTGATLEVSEVVSESDDYEEYVEKTAEAVGSAADALNYIKLLDISIMYKNEKVQINAPVDVQIKLLDKEETEDRTKVVHFGEDETNVIEPEVDSDIVSFETSGFSIYAVTSYGETSNLDGKTFAIVHVNTQATTGTSIGNNTVYQGRALQNTASTTTRLAGATVNVETHESGLNIVTSGTTEISEWTFRKASGENKYYIKASNGKYLNISANSESLTLSDTAQEITVTEGTGNYAGRIYLSNGNRNLRSNISANTATSTTTPEFYGNNTNDNNYIWMTLCEVQEIDPNQYPVYSGEKTSVQDLVDGQKCIIYQNIYNETSGKYEDFIIDGNGRPVKAYDQGDSVSLHSEISPMWVLHICLNSNSEPNGYYIFRNEETGLCLKPMADGTLVAKYESETTSGVALAGKEAGDYTSTIEFWDGSAMAWYGYQLTTTGDVVLSSATGSASQKFSFAKEPESTAGLHEVATVDSTTAGITIRMFDYDNRNQISSVTGSDSYGVGVLPAQHVSATLTNGYPTFTNGNSGSALFSPSSSYYKGTGNHLFLESVYDSTGYYEYSAFNNFAHYNQSNGTFTVYQETGTPSPTANNFYYKRGNFYPYNSLNTNNTSLNIYTGDGTLIDYENPSYKSTLYGLKETKNDYFGMTMEFNFLMPKDGYDKGSPLIYEFNGDDDLWIYIDGVLILDIGGIHDAFAGTINFATGEITGGNGGAGGARTIKDCFKKAGVFPDGSAWDDSKVDEYFKGNTFVSYGSHQFNMFYMEHGAGASNLKTRFNLPVIEKGKVTVEKQLDNTSQVNYANVSFAYQAFARNGGDFEPLKSAVYEGKTDGNGDPVPVAFYNNVVINGKTYDNVFYLKPTEAAVFSDLVEDEDYYVREIGIDPTYYDEVYVNDVQIVGEQVIEDDGIYKSTEATPRNRARVTFTNRCDNRNSNELLITKRLAEGSEDNGDTFEFRVMLENAAGVLSAYYQGPYYIRDDEGLYYRYEGGQLVENGQTPYACTAGNYGTIAQIPPDYTVVIKDLVAGTDFYVDEIRVRPNGATSDVLIGNSEWELVSRETTENDPAEITEATIWDYATSRNITGSALGSIAWNKDAHVTFTNKYKTVDVQLKKVKEDGTTVLSGSVFDLAKYANSTWSNNIQTDITPGAEATATTEAVPNPVDLGNLGVGKYKLTETKSPDGYVIQTKYIYFEVYMDTDKSLKARLIDENGTALTDAQIAELRSTVTFTSSSDDTVYTVTVINTPGAQLPNTGGSGTLLYTLSGLVLIFASALMYGFRMRRRERRSN